MSVCCIISAVNFDHLVKVVALCLAIINIITVITEMRIIIVAA